MCSSSHRSSSANPNSIILTTKSTEPFALKSAVELAKIGHLDESTFESPLQLEELDLDGNKLEGPIPLSIFNISSLVYVYLDSNQFNGTLELSVSPSACKPLEVKEHEWNEFVQVSRSLEWKKSEKGNDESIPRVELWIKGHIKKDGNVVNRASMVTMKKIKESSQDPNYKSSFSIKDDLLSQVIGPEHPGCVRGLGFGATSSNINAQLQVVSWKQAMNNKVNEVMERQKVMEEIISQLTSSMSHRDDNGNLEGKPCKLLNWIASGEVVAYGEISSTDPSALVDDVPLGPDCYKLLGLRSILICFEILKGHEPTNPYSRISYQGSTWIQVAT
ncbi:hypothetical protein Sjap_024165 [Stephania japonica]|uniref:Uncharacterized protein n=1 Tax=Stephania japonica TaxID=461633 RepID=A0AAP0HJM1_9MAGN